MTEYTNEALTPDRLATANILVVSAPGKDLEPEEIGTIEQVGKITSMTVSNAAHPLACIKATQQTVMACVSVERKH